MSKEDSQGEMEQLRDCSGSIPEWDPMEECFSSCLNVTSLNPGDPMAVHEGRNTTKENLCKFYDGLSDHCWKGATCMQSHVKLSGPILAEKRATFSVRTDKQRVTSEWEVMAKEVAPPGSIFKAIVSYVKSPEEFYLIPALDFGCGCYQAESSSSAKSQFKETTHQAGFENFKKFTQDLNRAMKSPKLCKTQNDFADKETVAANLRTITGKDFWTRGVCLEEVGLDPEEDLLSQKSPLAPLYLFDLGMKIKISTKEISPLPKLFSRVAPFAAKCKLHGIKPLEGTWTEEGVNVFKSLLNCPKSIDKVADLGPKDQITVQIKKSTGGHNPTIPTVPYSVLLYRAGDSDQRPLCLNEELVKLGFAEFEGTKDRMGLDYSSYDILYDSN